ncbi:MAG: flavin reductase family protein [Sulfolobales archaeon]
MGSVKADWVYLLHPRPAFAICSSAESAYDCLAASWVTPVSREPPILMVALSPRRATYSLIKSSGKATVNVLDWSMLEALHYLGSTSLHKNPNKMVDSGVKVLLSDGYVRIEGALAVLYCSVRMILTMGDHDAVFFDVVGVDVNKGYKPKAEVTKYNYIMHVGGGEYTTNVNSVIVL